MFRILIVLITALTFTISCSRQKKQDQGDTAAGGGATPEAAVEDRSIQFDSMGSDGGKISGLSTVFFEYDKATLSKAAQDTLSGNADWIKKNAKSTVQIEGHTDERGSIEYNLALGERRARTVKNYLVGLGVDASRLTIISYGEEKPLVNENNEAGWSKNRRANFVPLSQ